MFFSLFFQQLLDTRADIYFVIRHIL